MQKQTHVHGLSRTLSRRSKVDLTILETGLYLASAVFALRRCGLRFVARGVELERGWEGVLNDLLAETCCAGGTGPGTGDGAENFSWCRGFTLPAARGGDVESEVFSTEEVGTITSAMLIDDGGAGSRVLKTAFRWS